MKESPGVARQLLHEEVVGLLGLEAGAVPCMAIVSTLVPIVSSPSERRCLSHSIPLNIIYYSVDENTIWYILVRNMQVKMV